jgi:hypothetical protein
MKIFGILGLIAAMALGFFALTMDVSVPTGTGGAYGFSERVNNLGLMQDRQNYLIIAAVFGLAGLVFIGFSLSVGGKNEHVYKAHQELAQKAEYKGKNNEAIDHYQDALYHLENDYKNMRGSTEASRHRLVEKLKAKVEELKMKQFG